MSCCSNDGEVKPLPETTTTTTEPLAMTHEAADFVKEVLKKDKKEGWGLRIEVVPGGCAGYKYFMDFQENAEKGDKTFEFHGVKIYLDLMSSAMLKGSTIEFVSSLEATGLKINNPNATRGCGCGKSFG